MKKSVLLLVVVSLIAVLAFPIDNVFAKEHVVSRSVQISLSDHQKNSGYGSSSSKWNVLANFTSSWSDADIENLLNEAYQSKYGDSSSLMDDLKNADSVSIDCALSGMLSYSSGGPHILHETA